MSGSSSQARRRLRGATPKLSRRAILALIDKALDATSSNSSDDDSESQSNSDADGIHRGAPPSHVQDDDPRARLTADLIRKRRKRQRVRESSGSTVYKHTDGRSRRTPPDNKFLSWISLEDTHELGREIAEVVGNVVPRWLAEDPATLHGLEVNLAKIVANFALDHGLGADQTEQRESSVEKPQETNTQCAGQQRTSSSSFGKRSAGWKRISFPHETGDSHRVVSTPNTRSAQNPRQSETAADVTSFTHSTFEGTSVEEEDGRYDDDRSFPDRVSLDRPETKAHAESHRYTHRRTRGPVWSKEDDKKLIEMRNMNVPWHEAAAHFTNRTPHAVRARLNKLGRLSRF